MKPITIIFALICIFLFASCNGTNKQSQKENMVNETQQTQEVDTNKIYDMSEVDTPPKLPK